MATTATSPHLSQNSGSTGRWTGPGEPGSAFNGLSRGGRGRGSSRGRGGRGGRVASAGDNKRSPGGINGQDKTKTRSTSQNISTPVSNSVTLPTASGIEKTSVLPGNATSKSRGTSRRASRLLPSVSLQSNTAADIPDRPILSRPKNRRRRSQSGKLPSATLPKIYIPPPNDKLKLQQNRMGSAPHTAPIKDVPPDLTGSSFDMRHNIDALVERVRAIAMADNRPSTPGSHIDWARDDDDGLPDLDDWGVTPATNVGAKTELMSPIIVDGLQPLPGVDDRPITPSVRKVDCLDHPASTMPLSNPISGQNPKLVEGITFSVSASSAKPVISTSTTPSQQSSVSRGRNKVSSHELPLAKPIRDTNLSTSPYNSYQGASANRKLSSSKRKSASVKKAVPNLSAQSSDQLSGITVPPALGEQGLAKPTRAPIQPAQPLGLSASIHAPNNILESVSASNNSSSHYLKPDHHTHTRTQTIGRLLPQPEHNCSSCSGNSTPRCSSSPGGRHIRTHSTPPAGTAHRNTSSQRPVLTGDAISRLAKTIGSTTLSPAKITSVMTHD